MAAEDAAFDKIMEMVGNDGAFQKRFNYIYNAAMVIFGGMSFMNIILALNVPDHWCHVPGREHTNYTLEQWKHLTLPRETDVKGLTTFSKCQMYDVNWTTIQSWDYENWNSTRHHEKLNVLDCDVRDYDKTWYQSTIVSQEDWVCSKDMYQTNTFALNRIGEVIGTFFFGQLGDRFGRRIIFYISVSSIVFGRIATMFTTSYFTWFSIVSIVGSFCAISLFQSPFIIGMEISKPMICTLAYFTLILYIAQADGNPFLNFFIQSAIEAPAFFLANYMANTVGRRWTNSFSFIFASLFCIPTIILANYVEWQMVATCSVVVVKFWLAITFFVINLQAMETYPTCLRQTGLSIGTIGSNIIGIFGPYIVYLGQKFDNRYPIMILFVLCILGSICGLFLPETLHQKLPDSMNEARVFGADQKFWSLPKKAKGEDKNHNLTTDELERLDPLL
ncbi:carcinine transporter isoform X2 [Sitodiplosis mosellana]|uniref:carcinine transporter isoform X2 n=1 Tax=Sitodiplosis mosellana TaxID=263140 RepID=UPI00244474A9|nr:carcinine transporter isoform X2 [Sitodiplosis mosellana]